MQGAEGQSASPSSPDAAAFPSPLELGWRILERSESEAIAAFGALPRLPSEILQSLRASDDLGAAALKALAACAAILAVYALTRRGLAARRARAVEARSAFVGLVTLTGLELLALIAAALAGRILLVRIFGITPGTDGFLTDSVFAVVRWLVAVTVATILFQPRARRFRLSAVDDVGARIAVLRIGTLLAVGHIHNVLVEAALRGGVSLSVLKPVSAAVAIAMALAGFALLRVLKRHRMRPLLYWLAVVLLSVVLVLWLWGAAVRDFDLYHGAVGSITVLFLALALDRSLAISIAGSREAAIRRRLLLLRIGLDGVASVIVLRIVVAFWVTKVLPDHAGVAFASLGNRLTLGGALLVTGLVLAGLIHVWIDSLLDADDASADRDEGEGRRARLSTVLPAVHFVAVTVIVTLFALVALSTVGIDVTPLLAGAGIVGLAVSFGSQALVKDVVSGLFYMLDDVFRIGETIETGARKGVVEQINLRSVRLRGEDGRLHTIPLGDLGAVTNLSRRLATVTVRIPVDAMPAGPDILRFKGKLAAALRGDPAIRSALVGEIAAAPAWGAEGEAERLEIVFAMPEARARALRPMVLEQVLTAIESAGVGGLRRDVELVSAVPPPVDTAEAKGVP